MKIVLQLVGMGLTLTGILILTYDLWMKRRKR